MIRECRNENEVIGYIIEDGGEFVPIGIIENFPNIIKAIEDREIITQDDFEKNDKFRIQAINNKSESIITTTYPIYKQLNIDNQLDPYTLDDKEIKNIFISTVRLIGRQSKGNGTLVDDIDWVGLDKIESPKDINFETTKAIRDRIIQESCNES